MTNSCPSKEYGCSCTDNCQSYSSRLAEINQAERTLIAKQTAYPVLAVFAFGLLVAVFVGGGLSLNNHFARQALIDQEKNVSWR